RAVPAPNELVSVERELLHQKGNGAFPAPTGLVPVERRLLHQKGSVERSPPPPGLSRWSEGLGTRQGGGDCAVRRSWCRSLRSTETSSVGAGDPLPFCSGAEGFAPPRQARW